MFGEREKCFVGEERIIWGDWGVVVELQTNTRLGKDSSPGPQESHVYLSMATQCLHYLKSQLHNLNVSTS